MSPEMLKLMALVEGLQKQVNDIRQAKDVVLTESIRRNVLEDVVRSGVNDASTGTFIQAVNEAGAGSYNVSKVPNRRLRITVDGTDYYIGLYNV